MHVQSENGSVMKSNIPAKNVRTNAQNPGPSGSAEIEKIKSSVVRIWILVYRYSNQYKTNYNFPCYIIHFDG